MIKTKINDNCYEFVETEEEKQSKLKQVDNELVISDLMIENAILKQRLEDMEMIISDMLGGIVQ